VIRIYRKWSNERWTPFLRPRSLVVLGRRKINAKVFFIPARNRTGLFCTKEEPSDSGHALHVIFARARQYFNYCRRQCESLYSARSAISIFHFSFRRGPRSITLLRTLLSAARTEIILRLRHRYCSRRCPQRQMPRSQRTL